MAHAAGTIAYSHLTDGYWQIWTMRPEGSEKKQITFSKEDKRNPVFIHDGKKLAYGTHNNHIYLINLENGDKTRLLEKYGSIGNPHFSKETDEVVFARFNSRVTGVSQIWKANIDGTNARMITKDNRGNYQPRFSQDAARITFVKSDENKEAYHVWLTEADGSNPQRLTEGKSLAFTPQFSPAAKHIVFSANTNDNNFEIYLMDVKDKSIKQLTNNTVFDNRPYFSPDGQKIVFVSNRSGSQQIWVMDSDGSHLVQLTQGEDESIDPSWADVNIKKEINP